MLVCEETGAKRSIAFCTVDAAVKATSVRSWTPGGKDDTVNQMVELGDVDGLQNSEICFMAPKLQTTY